MAGDQKEAWEDLKIAIDKYNQACGSEVAVISTCLSEVDFFTQNLISGRPGANKMQIHGHGYLVELLGKFINEHQRNSMVRDEFSLSSSLINHASKPTTLQSRPRKDVKTGFNIPHSLPSTFMTMKVVDSSNFKPNPSTTTNQQQFTNRHVIRTPTKDHGATRNQQQQSGGRRSLDFNSSLSFQQRQSNHPTTNVIREDAEEDGDIELDEFVAFGEPPTPSSDSPGDEYSDDDADGESYQRRRRRYNDDEDDDAVHQIAASLPVDIQYPMNNHRRYNPPPPPPLIISSQRNIPTTRKNNGSSEQRPTMDNMMSHMQALARSVNDDSSLIFGERPRRPRVNSLRSFLQQQGG